MERWAAPAGEDARAAAGLLGGEPRRSPDGCCALVPGRVLDCLAPASVAAGAPGQVRTQVSASAGSRIRGWACALALGLPPAGKVTGLGCVAGRTLRWVSTAPAQPYHATKKGREMWRGLEKKSIKAGATDKGGQASRSSRPVPAQLGRQCPAHVPPGLAALPSPSLLCG